LIDPKKLQSDLKRLNMDQQIQAMRQLLAESYRKSLYWTAKDLLGYEHMTWFTHGKMIEALESDTRRKLIVMPRGTFKSSVGTVAYSIWRLLRNPNERILLDSEVYTNSKNFLREIRYHLESPKLTEIFGPFRTDKVWNEGEITIGQRTKTYKEASITAGGIGTVKVGQHYSIIIGDDMNSGNNSETPEGRQKVIQHYQMNTAILEPDGTYAIIGTRYAEDDVIGHILRNEVGPELKGAA